MSDVRDALEGLVKVINDRHYGRMPEEVQRAVDEASEALAPPKPNYPRCPHCERTWR